MVVVGEDVVVVVGVRVVVGEQLQQDVAAWDYVALGMIVAGD